MQRSTLLKTKGEQHKAEGNTSEQTPYNLYLPSLVEDQQGEGVQAGMERIKKTRGKSRFWED